MEQSRRAKSHGCQSGGTLRTTATRGWRSDGFTGAGDGEENGAGWAAVSRSSSSEDSEPVRRSRPCTRWSLSVLLAVLERGGLAMSTNRLGWLGLSQGRTRSLTLPAQLRGPCNGEGRYQGGGIGQTRERDKRGWGKRTLFWPLCPTPSFSGISALSPGTLDLLIILSQPCLIYWLTSGDEEGER
jgi:hypothetical protein